MGAPQAIRPCNLHAPLNHDHIRALLRTVSSFACSHQHTSLEGRTLGFEATWCMAKALHCVWPLHALHCNTDKGLPSKKFVSAWPSACKAFSRQSTQVCPNMYPPPRPVVRHFNLLVSRSKEVTCSAKGKRSQQHCKEVAGIEPCPTCSANQALHWTGRCTHHLPWGFYLATRLRTVMIRVLTLAICVSLDRDSIRLAEHQTATRD